LLKTNEEEYLLLMGNGIQNLWELKEKFKDFGGFYTGFTWMFSQKSEQEVQEVLSSFSEIRVEKQPIPPGSTFESWRQIYIAKYFKKNLCKIEDEITRRTEDLNLEEVSEEIIDSLDLHEAEKDEIKNLLIARGQLKSQISHKESMAEALSEGARKKHDQENGPFFSRLGHVLRNLEFAKKIEGRSYEKFEEEHKSTFGSGGLITGYRILDDQLYFSKGYLVTIQAMSNHGKSTLMLQLAYKFLSLKENVQKGPMCIFITYESTPLRIEEKMLNLIGNELGEGNLLLYNKNSEEKYLYPEKKGFEKTISLYNNLLKEDRLHFLKRVSLEDFTALNDVHREEYSGRTLVFFLDYLQIIDTSIRNDGWERIKAIAYKLESIAIEKEIILFTASQVNEKRQTREGGDIYNASTTLLDLINHSHASLRSNEDLKKLHKDPMGGKGVCSLSAFKQKHGASFVLDNFFLFNGFAFEENLQNRELKSEQGDWSELY